MQHQHYWDTAEPAIGHGSDLYIHPGYQSEGHHEYELNSWRHHAELQKHTWFELPLPAQLGPSVYPAIPVTIGSQNFGSVVSKQEYDSAPDGKWSPTLTNSSLASNTPSLPHLPSVPSSNYSPAVGSAESPVYWSSFNQSSHLPASDGEHSPAYWHISGADVDESSSVPCSASDTSSSKQHPEHPEAVVQALLDRPRRIKTTIANAKFYCRECNKGFQRIYNLRSHMAKHETSREKILCNYPGCNKRFDRKTDLGRHERSVHLHLREHKCVLCDSFFARKDTLVRQVFFGQRQPTTD